MKLYRILFEKIPPLCEYRLTRAAHAGVRVYGAAGRKSFTNLYNTHKTCIVDFATVLDINHPSYVSLSICQS